MSTLGNPHVDYIVGDKVVLPPHLVGGGEFNTDKNSSSSTSTKISSTYYSGKVLYLPSSVFPNSQSLLFPLDKPLFGIDPALDKSRSKLGLPMRFKRSTVVHGRHLSSTSLLLNGDAAGLNGEKKEEKEGYVVHWPEQREDVQFVFATFNKHLKIRSELFETWCSVLRKLPRSVLWMLKV